MQANLRVTLHDSHRRGAPRRRLRLATTLAGEAAGEVIVHDLSSTGLLLETPIDLSLGDSIIVDLPEADGRRAKVVWKSGHYVGCEFLHPIPVAALSAATLRSPTLRQQVETAPEPLFVAPGPFADAGAATSDLSLRTRLGILIALTAGTWAAIGLAIVAVRAVLA